MSWDGEVAIHCDEDEVNRAETMKLLLFAGVFISQFTSSTSIALHPCPLSLSLHVVSYPASHQREYSHVSQCPKDPRSQVSRGLQVQGGLNARLERQLCHHVCHHLCHRHLLKKFMPKSRQTKWECLLFKRRRAIPPPRLAMMPLKL